MNSLARVKPVTRPFSRTDLASGRRWAYLLEFAAIAIATWTLAAEVRASEFYDDYSTPGYAHSEANISWDPPLSTPGLGLDPGIVTGAPCTTSCVEFRFTGNPDLNHNGHSQLSFTHIPGLDEVTVEWNQFFPATWTHRDTPSPDDSNPFFTLLSSAATGLVIQSHFVLNAAGAEQLEVRFNVGGGAWTVIGSGTGVVPGKLGTWLPVEVYVKRSTFGVSNGIVRVTLDGTVIVNRNDLDLSPAAGNLAEIGQFMGFSQSGFSADSSTYIDDVRVTYPRQESAAIALVLDRSGSMNGAADLSVPPTDPQFTTKFDAAKSAAQSALQTLKPYLTDQDEAGAVFFNQNAPATTLLNATSTNVDGLVTTVGAEPSAFGATSVGDGLDSAKVVDAAAVDYKLILLLSDGYQNQPLFVVEGAGGGTLAGTGAAISLGPNRNSLTGATAFPPDVRVCVMSLGIGTQQMQWFNQELTLRRCRDLEGSPLATATIDNLKSGDPSLLNGFVSTIATALKIGDRLEKIAEVSGVVAAGTTQVQDFIISKNDIRISIPIVWTHRDVRPATFTVRLVGPGNERILLDPQSKMAILLEPNGQRTRLADIQFDQGQRHIVISFPLPLDSDRLPSFAGEWQLELERSADDFSPADYGILFLGDNRSIATEFDVACDDCGTGDTVELRARLIDRGKPVTGARVTARIESPDDSVGNVLSVNDTPDGSEPANDPLSPAEQKLQALLANPAILDRLRQLARPDIRLTDRDGDGVYTARYRKTEVAGNYKVTFMVAAETAENGRFERTQSQGLIVRAKPDTRKTKFDIELVDGVPGVNAVLKITFRDKFGNFVGPGFADLIKVTGKGSLVGAPVDMLDGSYVLNLNLTDLSESPDINVAIGGEDVSLDRPKWWLAFFLLLLIPLFS